MKFDTKRNLVEIAIYLNAMFTTAIALCISFTLALVVIGIGSIFIHSALCTLHSKYSEMMLLESMIEEIEEMSKKKLDKK